tara:strand:- start:2453 stop:3451 length:999 start_codon:yes stop_codon:yes gene_type:complete
MFGENLRFEYMVETIPALSERKRKTFENVTSAVREGIMTRNEAREVLGLSPVSGGDEIYISATLFPLGAESTPEPTEEEQEKDIQDYQDIEDDFDEILWLQDDKAISDIDFTPTDGMKAEAERGLKWRKEYNRGGTMVGVARANQLIKKEKLSPSTVKRMFSFFSRHEVDKQAEGFDVGEDGYPSAGRIAWALWGGDAGFSWSRKKRDQIEREEAKQEEILYEVSVHATEDEKKVSEKVRKALKKKVDDHNEKYGDNPAKRATLRMLEAVFRRGVGAYNNNPQSVRPSVSNSDQWAYARVNVFLGALRTGRFKRAKFDTDLLPKGHPLSTKK